MWFVGGGLLVVVAGAILALAPTAIERWSQDEEGVMVYLAGTDKSATADTTTAAAM